MTIPTQASPCEKHTKLVRLWQAAMLMPVILSLLVFIGFVLWIFSIENAFDSNLFYTSAFIAGINLLCSYVVTFVFALPMVYVVKRFKLLNYFSLVGIGSVSGFLVSLFFSSAMYSQLWDEMNTLGVGIGFAGGIVYCVVLSLLHRLDTHKPQQI